jgi:hypothetical protein
MINEKYSSYLPDATALYPTMADPKTGEILSGLTRHQSMPLLPVSEPQKLLA